MLRRSIVVVIALSSSVGAQPSRDLARAFQAGVDAFRLGKLAEARGHLERARALDPKLPGPHRFLAAVAQAERRWQDCIDGARAALALNPRSQELGDTRNLHEACRAADGRAPAPGELGEGAAIAVTTDVPGATVRIGGLAYGGTPLAPRTIPVGTHEVALAKAGYQEARVTVTALPGIVTDVIVELAPVAEATPADAIPRATGSLVVRGGGELVLDGRPAVATADGLALAPGTHVLEVRRAGKDPWRRRVAIAAGQRVELAPELVDTAARERVRRRGWILTGAGGALLVGGGVAFAVGVGADPPARSRLLVGGGVAALAGTAALSFGVLALVRGRAQDLTAPPPFALVPLDGGAALATAGRF